jgi:hypothetical protein
MNSIIDFYPRARTCLMNLENEGNKLAQVSSFFSLVNKYWLRALKQYFKLKCYKEKSLRSQVALTLLRWLCWSFVQTFTRKLFSPTHLFSFIFPHHEKHQQHFPKSVIKRANMCPLNTQNTSNKKSWAKNRKHIRW